MTTETSNKPNLATNNAARQENDVQAGELLSWIVSCSRSFLDELVLTFNDEELLKSYSYAHKTKTKQDVIYKAINKNIKRASKQIQSIKDFYEFVQGSAGDVKDAQVTLTSYRDGLRAKVNNLSKDHEIRTETRNIQKGIQGQLKVCSLIESGLKGYGKAVVAAHIIGKQEQVVGAANYIAIRASNLALGQNLEDKSIDGVNKVLSNVNKTINEAVAELHTSEGELNAFANKLAVETKTQRDHVVNKVNEISSQGQGVSG